MKSNEYYAGQDIKYPVKPKKPNHPARGQETATTYAKYAEDLSVYELEYAEYLKKKELYRTLINARIEECIQDLTQEYDLTNEQAIMIWHKAWEEGHASGMNEVISCFEDLVMICRKFVEFEKSS